MSVTPITAPETPAVMTRTEVADLLRIHPSNVSRMAQARVLPSFRVGARRLFRKRDVERYIRLQLDAEATR